METTALMIAIMNDVAIDEWNTRMCYIKRIFEKHCYLGTEDSMLKKNRFYYNDMFNLLYSLSNKQLEEVDIHLHGLCSEYAKTILAMQRAIERGGNDEE